MKTNRRDFLIKAGLASAAFTLFPTIVKPSVLGGGGRMLPGDKISMVLIGCGGQGRWNLDQFLQLNEVQVVAVCDVDKSQSALAKKMVDDKLGNSDCRVYNDFMELLEKEQADAAILALPDHWHALIGIAVANKKIDIYGEKPLARTIGEGRAVVNAAEKNNIVWQMGSWQRSQNHFRYAAELVINGRIGKVDFVEVSLHDGRNIIENPPIQPVPAGVDWDRWLGPAPKVPYRGVMHGNWRFINDYGGGQLTDWAGHHIDIAHWGLGLDRTGPVSVEGAGRSYPDGIYDAFAEYDFTCVYANGLKMRVANRSKLENAGALWKAKDIGILWKGSDGWVYVSRGQIKASDDKILKEVIGEKEINLYRSTSHHQNFIDCVRSRKETITPADVGHRSISVGLLGEIAMITGRKIHWDPQTEKFTDNDIPATRLLKRPFRDPWKL